MAAAVAAVASMALSCSCGWIQPLCPIIIPPPPIHHSPGCPFMRIYLPTLTHTLTSAHTHAHTHSLYLSLFLFLSISRSLSPWHGRLAASFRARQKAHPAHLGCPRRFSMEDGGESGTHVTPRLRWPTDVARLVLSASVSLGPKAGGGTGLPVPSVPLRQLNQGAAPRRRLSRVCFWPMGTATFQRPPLGPLGSINGVAGYRRFVWVSTLPTILDP